MVTLLRLGSSLLVIALLAVGAGAADTTFVSGTAEPSAAPVDAGGITSQSSAATALPSMSTARAAHTATRLLDGRVLIAGGVGSSLSYITAELYEPAVHAFKPVADMRYGRFSHTATLLPSGSVLIAGGEDQSRIPLSTAELFVPASATFALIRPMTTARVSHTATLLKTNSVLIAGGWDNTNGNATSSASAELFNPATRTFKLTGSMNHPRASHSAVLLADGLVLIIGGDAAGNTAEIYNPSTGKFSPTGSMLQARISFTATLISGGNVLITGGYWNGPTPLSSAEIYEPATGRFSAISAMAHARAFHTATALGDGTVLIAGGVSRLISSCDQNVWQLNSSVERFNPVTRQFTLNAVALTVARDSQTATLLSTGDVLLTGGYILASKICYTGGVTATAETIR